MFRAYDAHRECLVAVKLFKIDLPPDAVHRLAAEFERIIGADLAHPAIVAPTSTGITELAAFLVSDFVPADSLDLGGRERRSLTAADALRIARALAGALDDAAAAGVRHGSLHPRDVLYSGEDVRLTGLGVSQSLDQIGTGSPLRRPYAAPERVAGSLWGRRADVYSLAAIVYEILWGRRIGGAGAEPFDGLTDIPGANMDALARAFRDALVREPEGRTRTAGMFAQALEAALGDLQAGVQASVPLRRARKFRIASADAAAADSDQRAAVAEPLLPLGADDLIRGAPHDAARFADLEITPAAPVEVAAPAVEIAAREEPDPIDVAPAPVAQVAPAAPVGAGPMASFPAEMAIDDPPDTDSEPDMVADVTHPVDDGRGAPIELTLLDRSRSAVWPLALAMLVGVTLGFAAGYAVGMRDHPSQRQTVAAVPPPVAPGREFTETAVAEPPKPAPPAESPKAEAPRAEVLKPPSPANSVDPIGQLIVRTTPTGARVFVDGRESGRSPTSVRDLAAGAHRLRVTRDGYTTEERQFVVSRARPTHTVTVALARPRAAAATPAPAKPAPGAKTAAAAKAAPAPARTLPIPAAPPDRPARSGSATLVVESRPVGASVFIDDRLVGKTPMSVPNVVLGDHLLRLEHDGYRRWVSSIRVVAGDQNRVTASLER